MKKISFTKRPISIPADYRPLYKMAHIIMILKYTCIGNKSSLLKLHLLVWGLRTNENRELFKKLMKVEFYGDFMVSGIEPALNRALNFTVAESYCDYVRGKFVLTEKGKLFLEKIEDDKELFSEEKEFLNFVGKKGLTESALTAIAKKWKLSNDRD